MRPIGGATHTTPDGAAPAGARYATPLRFRLLALCRTVVQSNSRTPSSPASSRTVVRSYRRTLFALLPCLLLALVAPAPPAAAQSIRYGYDDLGRLQWVQDQTGDVAIYIYDPVGNILQIIRGTFPDPTAPVGISAFTPQKGGAGTTVTIFGRGFDPSPLQNTVTFNGTPATVTAATPVQLTATVPTGATTGPIAVTALAGTGTSPQAFTVLQAPTVSPAVVSLFPKQTVTFTASQTSQWRVNSALGGNAAVGTIAPTTGPTATYTAPRIVPFGNVVTITATNPDEFALQGAATVEVLPSTPVEARPVSVARALPTLSASPLVAPLVSVSLPPVFASPLVAPLVSVARALPTLNASPLEAPLVAAAREPVIIAVQDPATGIPAKFPRGTANQNVRLLGAGFTGATSVVFDLTTSPDPNITVNSFSVDTATQITANITIASGAAVGLRVARVTAAGVPSTAAGTGGNLLEVLP